MDNFFTSIFVRLIRRVLQIFCNTRSLMSLSLYSRLAIQYRAFLMDSISFSVASSIERGPFIFCSSSVNAVPELKKITTCSDRFNAGVTRPHVINSRFTFKSRSRRFGIHTYMYKRKSFVWFSCLRFTFTSRWNTGLIHIYF